MADDDFQMSLFGDDEEPEQKKSSLDYITIDFETANPAGSSACSVGLVRFINGKETDSLYTLICPPSDYFVQEWTDTIHHLTYEDVKKALPFPETWNTKVAPFIAKTPELPLVAHNAKFDMSVIWDCCRHYHIPLPKHKYFCSLWVARRTWPEYEHHALTFLGEKFGINYLAHEALEDARTCGIVVAKAAEKVGARDVEELLSKLKLHMESL